MAVTSVSLIKAGRGGSVKEDLNRSYTLRYRVVTNNANDGPERVLAHFEGTAGLPWFGTTYSSGNDTDIYAAVTDINVRSVKESDTRWNVDVKFSLPEKRDKENEPETDPTKRRDEYSIGFSQITETAREGVSRQDIPIPEIRVGDRTGIVVASGEPVPENLAPEKLSGDMIVTITRYASVYDASLFRKYVMRAVNSDKRIFDDPNYNYLDTWEPRQALIVAANASLEYENGVLFWKIALNVHLKQDTWDAVVPNMGFNRAAVPGSPDGKGGFYSSTDFKEGDPPFKPIKGVDGDPVNEPVWLDNSGQPLGATDQKIFYKWGIYEELPFAPLNLGRSG